MDDEVDDERKRMRDRMYHAVQLSRLVGPVHV
jgi:hypothetical protein